VIQNVIEKCGGEKVPKIFEILETRIFDLATHKFASNVVEKCVVYGTNEQRKKIVNQILSKDDQTHDSLLAMVKDKFGNYVVQQIIQRVDDSTKENIVKRIINSQALKKRDGFSKHVISFIEKMGFSAATLHNLK